MSALKGRRSRYTTAGKRIYKTLEIDTCADCGMGLTHDLEFHPYAACQVFRHTHDSNAVREVLKPMLDTGISGGLPAASSAGSAHDRETG